MLKIKPENYLKKTIKNVLKYIYRPRLVKVHDFFYGTKNFLYHVINDIFKQQDEAVVCHPDNFVYEFSTQERLSLAHTET